MLQPSRAAQDRPGLVPAGRALLSLMLIVWGRTLEAAARAGAQLQPCERDL
jgi:hypothetical protein